MEERTGNWCDERVFCPVKEAQEQLEARRRKMTKED